MADDLGYGDLSCYGAKDVRTPHIDKLAAEGVRFTNFYANCCVCSPSRAALLSGRYPEFVGVPGVIRHYPGGNWGHLTPESIMLPALFQEKGYHTSLIGKWHLGLTGDNSPNRRGFDEFHGWLGDMVDDYWKHRRAGKNYMRLNGEVIDPEGHATDLFTGWSIASIKRRAAEGKPWFQFLAYNAPHDPIQPPKDWLEKVMAREPGISADRAGIVALIEHMDHGIGEVLKALDDLGLRDNTIVVFTSDNGGALQYAASNGSLRSGKGHVYQGGLVVPTCIRWPGRIEAGRDTDFRALTMDLIPTIAELCGVPIGHSIEGKSFGELLVKKEQPAFARPNFHMWLQETTKETMIDGDWKIVRDEAGKPYELFNIKDDPYETTDLAEREPEKLAGMAKVLESHMADAKRVPWKRP